VKTALCSLTFPSSLAAQQVLADRGLPPDKLVSQSIELAGKGFLGGPFRVCREVLFCLPATDRPQAACPLDTTRSPAAAPSNSGDRWRPFHQTAMPKGFAEAAAEQMPISVQVSAHRLDRRAD